MNRKEYMERLDQLLLVLPEEEREEALQYYHDYFDDAGVEDEEKVIRELGTPEEVAAKIRAGFAGESGEYSEQGFEDVRFHKSHEIVTEAEKVDGTWEEAEKIDGRWEEMPKNREQFHNKEKQSKNNNIWKVIAIIVLILFAAPIMLPVGIAVIAVVFSLIVAVLAVLFGVGVSGFAILLSGIVVIVAGIAKMILAPATGILAAGIGCILLAIGVLVSWVIVSLFVKVVPGMIRGMVKLLGTPFRKAGAK